MPHLVLKSLSNVSCVFLTDHICNEHRFLLSCHNKYGSIIYHSEGKKDRLIVYQSKKMIAYSPPKNGKKMHRSKSIMVSAGIPTSKLTSLQKERSCTMQYLVLALGVLGVFGCLFDPLGRLTACSCGVFACLRGCVSQAELMRPYHSSQAHWKHRIRAYPPGLVRAVHETNCVHRRIGC